MTHSDDTQKGPDRAGQEPRDLDAERPDLQGPRGNQDVETIDVERGEEKIERVLGW